MKKSKIVNVRTGAVTSVNLHPSKIQMFYSTSDTFRNRIAAVKLQGFILQNRSIG